MELQEFLDRFDGVQSSGSGWSARCPAHEDRKASLSISANSEKILINCHAGCDTLDVLAEASLSFDDLFFKPLNGHKPRAIDAIEYSYRDETGHLLYQVLRYPDKEFKQRHPDELGGWVWNLKGVTRVPYMLPEIAARPDEPLFIVEGEKDVHTLRSHGYLATTNSGGAKGPWDKEWNKYFIDRVVYLIPDRDKPGYDRVNRIGRILNNVCSLYVIELQEVKDITEWLERHRPDELSSLTQTAERWAGPIFLIDERLPDIPFQGLMGEIVDLLAPHSEASPVALYVELMTMIGACLNAGPHFKIGGTRHRGNLFVIICGQTAKARKGTAHDAIKDFFRRVDELFVSNCCRGGLSTGEGMIAEVQDPVLKPMKDGTDKVINPGAVDTRKIFSEPEIGGRTLKVLRREGNTLSSVMREAWESTELHVSTRTDRLTASNAHISIIGHSTLDELTLNLNRDDITNGFANRFLFFLVSHSTWKPIITEPDEAEMIKLANRLREALTRARMIQAVHWTEQAQVEWNKTYVEMMESDAGLGLYESMLGRGPAQIMRMAMIHAVVDGRKDVTTDDQKVALALWEYSVKSVSAIASSTEQTMMPTDARKVFDYLEGLNDDISVGQLKDGLKWNGGRLALAKGWLLKNRMIHEYPQRGGKGRPRIMIGIDR